MAETAEILGKSRVSVYSKLKQLSDEQVKRFTTTLQPTLQPCKAKNATYITEEGLYFLAEAFGVDPDKIHHEEDASLPHEEQSESAIIEVLTAQLKAKDEQIASLLEQNRNFQLLLANQQKLLPPPRKSLWKRLFGSES